MPDPLNYYGLDRSLNTVEFGTVSIEQALKVVDERFANLKPKYESAEEAMAETTFGFSRTPDTFIEVCIQSAHQISFKLEIQRPKKFLVFSDVYHKETELKTKEDLIEQVKAFFSMDVEAYRRFVASRFGELKRQ